MTWRTRLWSVMLSTITVLVMATFAVVTGRVAYYIGGWPCLLAIGGAAAGAGWLASKLTRGSR